MAELGLPFRSSASHSRCDYSMFDPQREICSGVFSSLENPYRKLNSFLSGKAMRAALKLQELNSASGETSVRCSPCSVPLPARCQASSYPTQVLLPSKSIFARNICGPNKYRKRKNYQSMFHVANSTDWLSVKKTWGGYSVPSPTYWLRPSVAPASIWGWCVLTGKPGEPKIFPGYCFIAP